jgi:phenylpropionate dioxygenase-like ring-hydroxylating dioxygenase large terminal subunit
MTEGSELIYDMWYVAAPASAVARSKTKAITMLNQPVLLGRDKHGAVFALRDFCPHRGVPLHYGTFDGETVECCYHGWCFDTKGQCTKIPALTDDAAIDLKRIKAQAFPCREADGLIWVFVPQPKIRIIDELPEVPAPPIPLRGGYQHIHSVVFPCDIDHAVLGLMDPSHGSFVHVSWWWRSKRSIHAKAKKFAPHGLGFKMLTHTPSANSRGYKILGGDRTTEITFELPGLRTEHITIGKRHVVLLTALTPIDENTTQLHQFMYTTVAFIRWLKPVLAIFGRAFIQQDLDIVQKQQEGLKGEHPALMLIGDADAQAVWYTRLKKDYREAKASNTPFENRIPEKTLRWRS